MQKLIPPSLRVISLLVLLCLLSSCALRPRLPADYRTTDFEAEISFFVGACSVTAIVTAKRPHPTDPARITSVRIIDPPALARLLLTEKDGTLQVTCHDLTAPTHAFDDLWAAAELLTLQGNMTAVSHTKEHGKSLLYATLPTDSGLCEWYLDPNRGYPYLIRCQEQSIQIRSFAPRS